MPYNKKPKMYGPKMDHGPKKMHGKPKMYGKPKMMVDTSKMSPSKKRLVEGIAKNPKMAYGRGAQKAGKFKAFNSMPKMMDKKSGVAIKVMPFKMGAERMKEKEVDTPQNFSNKAMMYMNNMPMMYNPMDPPASQKGNKPNPSVSSEGIIKDVTKGLKAEGNGEETKGEKTKTVGTKKKMSGTSRLAKARFRAGEARKTSRAIRVEGRASKREAKNKAMDEAFGGPRMYGKSKAKK
jgi:hypothetical protein